MTTTTVPDRSTGLETLSTLPKGARVADNAADLLRDAGMLDWNVRTVGVSASEVSETGVTGFDLPRSAASVYTDPATGDSHAIGVVGKNYTPIQNEYMVPFLDALLETSGGRFNTAGFTPDHGRVFVGIKTPTTISIGGADDVMVNMLMTNSHDGTGAFTVSAELVRLVCTNGMTAAIPGTRSHVSVRHTSGAIDALAQAHESLDAVTRYASAFEKASEPLLTKQYVDDEFSRIIERLLPVKSEENPHVSAILSLRHGSSTIDDAFRGSAWSAYQSFTEYADHFMPVRFAGDAATGRAMRSIGTAMPRAKSRLFQALIEA